jgi:hypothetical protein
MGRRNRIHTIKIAYWQENTLIKEEYETLTFAEALEMSVKFTDAAVNIYDINNTLVYFMNLEIIDLIPETKQESIEEIIEELKKEEIIEKEETDLSLDKEETDLDDLFSVPKMDTIQKSTPVTTVKPVKKTVTKVTAKAETKKAATKKATAKTKNI